VRSSPFRISWHGIRDSPMSLLTNGFVNNCGRLFGPSEILIKSSPDSPADPTLACATSAWRLQVRRILLGPPGFRFADRSTRKKFDEENRAQKPSLLLRPALFDWFEARITQCPARTRRIQLGEVLRTTIRWEEQYRTGLDQEHSLDWRLIGRWVGFVWFNSRVANRAAEETCLALSRSDPNTKICSNCCWTGCHPEGLRESDRPSLYNLPR
jgi:hypothetical protein